MRVGVLALQGAFIEHEKMLSQLGTDSFEIRQQRDILKSMDGIIIPGGESTVMGKLSDELGMTDELKRLIDGGLPAFGTCAGLIILAKRIAGGEPAHLGLMDIEAKRNAYGRQLGSFCAEGEFDGKKIPLVFIRAPYVSECGENAKVLTVTDGKITAVREKNMLAAAFHPELSDDLTVHSYFIDMMKGS